jgi:hypothetical protein
MFGLPVQNNLKEFLSTFFMEYKEINELQVGEIRF